MVLLVGTKKIVVVAPNQVQIRVQHVKYTHMALDCVHKLQY